MIRADHFLHLFQKERRAVRLLNENVPRAQLYALESGFLIVSTCQQNRDIGIYRLYSPVHLPPVDILHQDVQHHHADLFLVAFENFQRLHSAVGR